VLGVSFDSPADNKAFAEKFKFPFRLLSDPERKMGLAYKACDDPSAQYARRYTYVIGPDGTIEQAIDTKDAAGQADALLKTL
jgi:peroxiredoxin Q/BCP